MDNEKIEWLHDHYKETYSLSKEAQKDRNKYFVFLCVSVTCLLMFLIDTNAVEQTMAGWYTENISTAGISFHVNTIQSFVWVINLYLFIRYIQTNTYVERQYKYIENLETKITQLSGVSFTRESKSYLESYPKVLDFIHIIYVGVFPIISFVIILIKIVNEWMIHVSLWHSVFDSLIGIIILILLTLYFFFLHPIKRK